MPVPVAAELSFSCSLSAESLHIQEKSYLEGTHTAPNWFDVWDLSAVSKQAKCRREIWNKIQHSPLKGAKQNFWFKKTHTNVIIIIIFLCFCTPLIPACAWKSLVAQVSVSAYAAGKADELSWIKSGIVQTEFKTDLRLKESGQFIVSIFEHLLTFWPGHDCTVSSKSRKYNINLTWKPLPLRFLT